MKYGLSNKQLEIIRNFLSKESEVEEAVLFGSRAMDTFKEASDIDLALKGDSFDFFMANSLKNKLEDETNIPFFFDIIAYNSIKSDELKQHIRDKGVVIYRKGMGEWKEYNLIEILQLIGGGTPKTSVLEYWNGEIPWLSVKDYNNGKKYCYNAEKSITSKGLHESSTKILKKGQIIISARGTVGVVSMLGNDMAFNQSSYGIDADISYTCNDYLFYWLKNAVQIFISNSYGAVFNTITKSTFENLQINLPPLSEQKAIAAVLSSLDDKIDLLCRQNKTLEAMAETLFREWFVEEAEDDWKDGCLDDIAYHIRQGIKPSEISTDTKYIGLEHIDKRNIALKENGSSSDVTSNKYEFLENDILFGKLRPYFHKVCFTPYPGICSTDILVIRPKQIQYFCFCLFAFFQNDVVEYANLGSSGTKMPRTDWKVLKNYPFQKPDEITLENFNKLILPSIKKIKFNLDQIRTLEKLRDTLLPKLMSGEVRVHMSEL